MSNFNNFEDVKNFKDVKLEKSMYHIAGKSFLDVLESLDPSNCYQNSQLKNLDAYERQLKRFDIKVSGDKSDSVEKFFSCSETASLFPEYVLRAVKTGFSSDSVLDNIVAAKTIINSLDYRTISCDPSVNAKELKAIAEGAAIPATTVSLKNSLIKLVKSGRLLISSYEALKSQKLDVFSVALRQIGNYISTSQLKQAVSVLISGDGNDNQSQVMNLSSRPRKDNKKIDYQDLIGLWSSFSDDFEMNTLLVSPQTMTYLLDIDEFKNPATGLNFQKTGKLTTPLGANLYKSSVVPDNMIIALDKNFALEMVSYGDVCVEYDKLIDRQLERAAITATYGFSKICPKAVKILKFS